MSRISWSQLEIFKTCPRKWWLHYKDNLRSIKLSSPLHFGIAIDEAQGILLLKKKKKLPGEEKQLVKKDPYKVFDHLFTEAIFDKDVGPENISSHHLMDYYNSDFDENVLFEEDYELLEKYIEDAGFEGNPDPIDLYEEIKEDKNNGELLELTQLCYFNYCSWLSLRRKGHLILDSFIKNIMPKIKVVHSIQKKVSLPNGEGDELIGYIDAELEFEDEPEVVYTVDFKTSSSRYDSGAVNDIEEKGQLLIYDEFNGLGFAAYCVLMKKIKVVKHKTCQTCGEKTTGREAKCAVEIQVPGKRPGTTKKSKCKGEFDIEVEPYSDFQIIKDNVDEEKKDLLFEEISDIMENMENKVISKNLDACFSYGKPCAFFNYCRTNGQDLTDLVKKVYRK